MKKLLPIILILIVGCASNPSSVGQKLPFGNYVSASVGVHNTVTLKHIILIYATQKNGNTITAEGKIIFRTEMFRNDAYFDRVKVKAHLADENYTIVREVSFSASRNLTDFEPIPFKVEFPYDKSYRYVAFSYQVFYRH
jgi:hypothetical protein